MDGTYRFLIQGHLDDRWSEWLGDLAIERRSDGTSVLSGPVADQAALHGVIARIRDLGMPLLAVGCTGEVSAGVSRSAQPGARGSPNPYGITRDSLPVDDTDHATTNFEGDYSCD